MGDARRRDGGSGGDRGGRGSAWSLLCRAYAREARKLSLREAAGAASPRRIRTCLARPGLGLERAAHRPAPSLGGSSLSRGEVPEWSIGAVSKTVVPLRVPRVRIPPSPPFIFQKCLNSGHEPFMGILRLFASPVALPRRRPCRRWLDGPLFGPPCHTFRPHEAESTWSPPFSFRPFRRLSSAAPQRFSALLTPSSGGPATALRRDRSNLDKDSSSSSTRRTSTAEPPVRRWHCCCAACEHGSA